MKENSLPAGYASRTTAPPFHQELIDTVKALIDYMKLCNGGEMFMEHDLLRLYRFLLEYGLKKNETVAIPWRRFVQAVYYISLGACALDPTADQMRRLKALLLQFSQWKQDNLHHRQLIELPTELKEQATSARLGIDRKRSDDLLNAEASRALRWKPSKPKR